LLSFIHSHFVPNRVTFFPPWSTYGKCVDVDAALYPIPFHNMDKSSTNILHNIAPFLPKKTKIVTDFSFW